MSEPLPSGIFPIDRKPVWLITGCSSGFGRALSAALFAKGVSVIATARNPKTLAHLPDGHDRVLKVALDVTQPETIDAAIAAAVERLGRIDVLVNNAGIGVIGPVEDVTDEQTRLQFEVNVFGLIAVTRAAQPIFRAQRSGMFINFASVAGESSVPSLGIYSASKFAVEGFSEALRDEMAPYGVKVMIVEPGPFNTEWIGKNAVWADRTENFPEVWEYVATMQGAYADRTIVGDPERAAESIIAGAALEPTPFRLPLGDMSLDATRQKSAALVVDLDRLEPLIRNVHYLESPSIIQENAS
jgi:NAD(P)-dependent dehydrogenase (short-subunit alcohol dehydrogenase family)